MARSLAFAIALASVALVKPLPASADVADRTLPMRFDLRLQGPAESCGVKCQLWISASGAITADTPRDFELFAQNHDLTGATVALDSDGGSVLGAIALGRAIRRSRPRHDGRPHRRSRCRGTWYTARQIFSARRL